MQGKEGAPLFFFSNFAATFCSRNGLRALEGRLSLELGRVRSVPGEGVLGRYGHCGNNQRPGADAADGTSRTRALAVSRSHRRGREWPTPSNKKFDAVRKGLFH